MLMSNTKKRAFGLIEVMTALTVMIVVIGAVATVTRQSILTAQNAKDSIVAAGLAQDVIEQVTLVRNENPQSFEATFAPTQTLNNIEYSRDVTIDKKTDDALYGGEYWEVKASINWYDSQTNSNKNYTLKTILTKWQ